MNKTDSPFLSISDFPEMEKGAPGDTDAERAAWLVDKIGALGDYAKEAAAMLRRWPTAGVKAREPEQWRQMREALEHCEQWLPKDCAAAIEARNVLDTYGVPIHAEGEQHE